MVRRRGGERVPVGNGLEHGPTTNDWRDERKRARGGEGERGGGGRERELGRKSLRELARGEELNCLLSKRKVKYTHGSHQWLNCV